MSGYRVPWAGALVLSLMLALLVNPALSETADRPTFDEQLLLVSERVPSFGGAYFGGDSASLYVWLLDPTSEAAEAAKQALVEVLQMPGMASRRPVPLRADYSFASLKAWHDKITIPVLDMPGAVLTDIDDTRNRIRIGIEDLQQEAAVEAELASQGVPAEAVIIEQVQPEKRLSSLRTQHRPLVGGLEIESLFGTCTLGFPAIRASITGWVTNSHCTNIQGGVEATEFGQPTLAQAAGVETADPQYRPCGERLCRYSDAAFARVAFLVATNRGRIAKPSSGVQWNGTTTYRITAEGAPVFGQQRVYMVGRTSGQRTSFVDFICVNVNQTGTNFRMLCQSQATGFNAQPGDSGAPVFQITSGNDVALIGIQWGTTTFSPVIYVQRSDELGNLTFCASGFSC